MIEYYHYSIFKIYSPLQNLLHDKDRFFRREELRVVTRPKDVRNTHDFSSKTPFPLNNSDDKYFATSSGVYRTFHPPPIPANIAALL